MKLKTFVGIAALFVLNRAAFGQGLPDFVWRRPAISPSSVAFHPDGYFFVGGYGHACFAVTTANGLVIQSFGGGFSACRFGTFSPDGRFLAVSSEGFRGSVSFGIFETQTWMGVGGFSTGELFTNAGGLMFSPDGRSLIACITGTVYVLDVPGFGLRFRAQASCPASISPNSELLLVATSQGVAKILGLADGLDRTPPSGYPGLGRPWVLGDNWIALSEPNGIHVKTLAEPPQELAMMPAYRPQALVRSPDDQLIGGAFDGGAGDKMIEIWETSGFSSLGSWATGEPFDFGSVLAFTSDSQSLATAGLMDRDPVKLWRVADGMLQQILITDPPSNTELVFSPDSQLLAGGFGQDGHIRLWQSADGALVQTLAGLGGVTGLAFSPDGRFIGSAGDDLNVWSLADGTLIQSISEATIEVAVSADGLLAQQLADEVRLRTLPDLSLVRTIPRGGPIAFSPDGRQLLVGAALFDVDSGSQLRTFSASAPTIALFSPDGGSVAFADLPSDSLIKRFDAQSGNLLASFGWTRDGFTSFGARISSLRFSPDGRSLAQVSIRRDTPGETPVLRIWDLNGNLLRSYVQGIARSLSYSPDGRYIATLPADVIGVALNPCAGPSCPPDPMPAANLFENFGSPRSGTPTLNPGLWSTEVSAGRLTVNIGSIALQPDPNTGDSRLIVSSAQRYSLLGSSVSILVSEVVAQGNVNNGFSVQLDADNSLQWGYEGGILYAASYVGGKPSVHAALPYSVNEHQYWRVRESGGTVFWETRDYNLGPWVARAMEASLTLFPLDGVQVVLSAATFGSGSPSPGRAVYGPLNDSN